MENDQQENNVDNEHREIFGSEAEEDPFQDSGSEYQPSGRNSTASTTDLIEILGHENQSPNNVTSEITPVKPRKRVRQPSKWKKNVRKEKRSRGEEYVNVKGVLVPPKQIDTACECNCQHKCHEKILPAQQRILFNSFYALGNYNLQTSYLFSLIKVMPKKTCTASAESRRSNSRVYQVLNGDGLYVTVCKTFFKKLFGVSDGIKMTKDDFISTKKLENNITNRKITAEKSKVQWLSMQWILFNKMHPFKLFFKYSNNEDVLFENVDLKKRGSTDLTGIRLDPLYPDGKPISCEKKKDLLDLLPFIPPVHHSFYTSIKDNVSVRNVIDVEDDIDSD